MVRRNQGAFFLTPHLYDRTDETTFSKLPFRKHRDGPWRVGDNLSFILGTCMTSSSSSCGFTLKCR